MFTIVCLRWGWQCSASEGRVASTCRRLRSEHVIRQSCTGRAVGDGWWQEPKDWGVHWHCCCAHLRCASGDSVSRMRRQRGRTAARSRSPAACSTHLWWQHGPAWSDCARLARIGTRPACKDDWRHSRARSGLRSWLPGNEKNRRNIDNFWEGVLTNHST